MSPIQFRQLQQELRNRDLLGANDAFGLLTFLTEVLIFGGCVTALFYVELGGWAYCLFELLCGLSLFRWFVVVHECGHNTLFKKRFVNTVVGHVASVFCLIPYFAWRNIHLLHHRWVGVIDKDPTQRDLLKLLHAGQALTGLFRLIWKLWLPIPFAKFLFEVFWLYPIDRYKHHDRRNVYQWCVSNLVCLLPHVLFGIFFGWTTWFFYFVPMLLVFYFLIENMNLPQHSELFPYLSDTHPDPIPFAEQDAITRSTHLPDWLGVVLALNFNRHTEHHLFPAAPWYSLNAVRRVLLQSGYKHPHEVQMIGFMWRLRQRDPLVIYRDALPRPRGEQHG
jgi:omega-6 fatty acid desaturase (delta-12 desaturase)